MLPLWRETFSKAHHQGSGYAGTGVMDRYGRKAACGMGRSIHQPSAGELVKLTSLELWILECSGFTPHRLGTVGRQIEGLNAEDVALLNTLDRPFYCTVFARMKSVETIEIFRHRKTYCILPKVHPTITLRVDPN